MIGISGSMELIKNTDGTDIYPLWRISVKSGEGPVSQIHSPRLHAGTPEFFSDVLKSVQMEKIQWGGERIGKLLHLFIPSKTTILVPEFAVKDLPWGRTLW